jgi:SAM-dependent methyltransferase
MHDSDTYLMESKEETFRLDIKTNPDAVRQEAAWCGIKPGMRVLDAGCGSGKTSSILHDLIQPGGTLVGMDYIEKRIDYANEHYGKKQGLDFQVHDLRAPLNGAGLFDLIWVRFVLEYNLLERNEIVKNLTACLKPDGYLCLIDLDYNCLSHYEMPSAMEDIIFQLMAELRANYNFDPYVGRKLYATLYDLGYRDIDMHLIGHHLIYGEAHAADVFNWTKKIEMAAVKLRTLFDEYPGGAKAFSEDFKTFFLDPRRFTYTPMILCKGRRPIAP